MGEETWVDEGVFLPRACFLFITQKLRPGYFRLDTFVQSLINKNYHKSRTNDGIDLKLGLVTK